MSEKLIRVMKLDCLDACGWGIHNGEIRVEVAKTDWKNLEQIADKQNVDMDFVLAEATLKLFTENKC